MQINRRTNGVDDMIRELRNEPCNHASEDVSTATFCQSGIPGRIDPNVSFGIRDQRAPAFENQHQPMFARKVAPNLDAISLNLFDTLANQTAHLTGMRRENEGTSAAIQE